MVTLSNKSRSVILSAVCLGVALMFVLGANAQPRQRQADDFKVMIISGFNTFSNANPEILSGAQAAAAAINKAGGLRGRMIQVDPCSHQSSTAGDAACARRAVAEGYDDIIWRSNVSGGGLPIADQAGIPHIGTILQNQTDYVEATSFPVVTTSQAIFVAAMGYALKNKALKRWAAVGVENSGSGLTVAQTKYVAQHNGRQWVGGFLSPVLATDYLAIAQKLASASPDVVVASLPVGGHLALQAAFSQIGFEPKAFISNTATLTASVISQMASPPPGLIGGSELPPATLSAVKLPIIKLFRDQINAAGLGGDPVNFATASQLGWIGIQALKKLADRTTGPVTKEKLVAAARAATSLHPIDMFGAFKWTPGARGPAAVPHSPNGIAWASKFVNGEWTVADPNPYDAWRMLGIARK